GTPADGINISSIDLESDAIEIFGNRHDLEKINEISGEIDVKGVSSDTEREVKLDLPKNVTKTSPEKLKAKINVE
ncbi:CdaR family protein, partial [Staphylococcus pseudintermedius]